MLDVNLTGTEFDWFAADRDGHVAFFSSAGSGIVPRSVSSNPEAQLLLAKVVDELPRVTRVEVQRGADEIDEWHALAARGLFVYDNVIYPLTPNDYRLLMAPGKPLMASDLPEEARQGLCRLQDVAFASCALISPAMVETAE